LSSHLPLDHIDSGDNFSNSVLYLAENWMQDTVFLSFETENWKWLLRHFLNFLCELNFQRVNMNKFYLNWKTCWIRR